MNDTMAETLGRAPAGVSGSRNGALLLDIDGTLADSVGLFFRTLNETLGEFGYPETHDMRLFGQTAAETLDCLAVREQERFLPLWLERFNSEKPDLYPGIPETLKLLWQRGAILILVSSRDRQSMAPLFRSSEIGHYLHGAVAYDDTARHKPHPEPLLFALEHYSLNSSRTLYVGDSEADALAAREAGIPLLLAGWNPHIDRNLPGLVLDEPRQLLTLQQPDGFVLPA